MKAPRRSPAAFRKTRCARLSTFRSRCSRNTRCALPSLTPFARSSACVVSLGERLAPFSPARRGIPGRAGLKGAACSIHPGRRKHRSERSERGAQRVPDGRTGGGFHAVRNAGQSCSRNYSESAFCPTSPTVAMNRRPGRAAARRGRPARARAPPNFEENRHLYVYLTTSNTDGRGDTVGRRLTDPRAGRGVAVRVR